jgi:SET and MYND domain-containing protein
MITVKEISGDKGRGTFSAKKLSVGELVLKERPLVYCADAGKQVCNVCFLGVNEWSHKSNAQMKLCTGCKAVYYCSRECQTKDWLAFHMYECGAYQKMPKKPFTLLRILSRIMMLKRHNESEYKNKFEVLVHKVDKMKLADKEMFGQILMAIRNYFGPEYGTSVKEFLEACSRSSLNSIGIQDVYQEIVGVGIYTQLSMINHACEPNAEVVWDREELIVRMLKPLASDEEVYICYLNYFMPTRMIRKQLQDQYHFTCSCSRCSTKKDPFEGYKCFNGSCDGFINIDEDVVLKLETPVNVECETCGSIAVNFEKTVAACIEARAIEETAQKFLDGSCGTEDVTNLFVKLRKSLDTLQMYLYRKNYYLSLCLESYKEMFVRLGMAKEAYDLLEQILSITKEKVPSYHSKVAYECHSLALVSQNKKQASHWFEEAHKIYASYLSPEREFIKRLEMSILACST